MAREVSNWDPRLDTGSGNGRADQTKGHCDVCSFKGRTLAMIGHHRETGHTFTWRGTRQRCAFDNCICKQGRVSG